MRVRMLYFAALRQAAGATEQELELPVGACFGDARRAASESHPALGALLASTAIRGARNGAFVAEDEPLAEGDELALIPPVSGG